MMVKQPRPTWSRLPFGLVLCLLFAAKTSLCETPEPIGIDEPLPFQISPQQVQAGTSFSLSVLSYDYSCAVTYSHLSHHMEGDKLYLNFLPDRSQEPVALCPAIHKPYGLTFDIEALEAGTYSVYAVPLVECMVGNPACEIAVMPQFAGQLVVAETGEFHWFIEPKSVEVEEPFTLKLLSHQYGSCQTSFGYPSAQVENGKLVLDYYMESHPERVCIWDERPFGPVFEVPGLPAGRYPVEARLQHGKPNSGISVPGFSVQIVDTLVVGEGEPAWPRIWVEPDTVAAGRRPPGSPGSVRSRIWVEPDTVAAGETFRLELWGDLFQCSSIFSDKQVAVHGTNIHLSFIYSQSRRLCDDVLEPRETSFYVPALPEGVYAVTVHQRELCTSLNGMPCIDEVVNVYPADSIVIGGIAPLNVRAPDRPMLGPAGEGAALLSLPADLDERAVVEIRCLSGRLVRRLETGGRSRLNLQAGLEAGVYWVHLRAPGHKPETLRLVLP